MTHYPARIIHFTRLDLRSVIQQFQQFSLKYHLSKKTIAQWKLASFNKLVEHLTAHQEIALLTIQLNSVDKYTHGI